MFQYEIIVDHGETANKCTILPLDYRQDFILHRGRFQGRLKAELLLHPDGEPLEDLRLQLTQTPQALGLIDCIWRRLNPILNDLEKPLPRFVAIPREFKTAYPRVSKHDFDPEGGLATIEALFVAAAFLGQWDTSLLREYYFAERFLELNAKTFEHYDIKVSWQSPLYHPARNKDARTRRWSRGRGQESLSFTET